MRAKHLKPRPDELLVQWIAEAYTARCLARALCDAPEVARLDARIEAMCRALRRVETRSRRAA